MSSIPEVNMKTFYAALILALLFSCAPKKQTDPTKQTEVVTIKLPSIVCGTCQKTIEKAIYHVEGVKNVDVDVDGKKAEVTFVSYQTNLQVIERAINEAGYDANETKRDPDAYQKLDKCCKIDG